MKKIKEHAGMLAMWIISICEVIRIIQNQMQLKHVWHNEKNQDNAYAEFIDSLHRTDKEFVKGVLEEIAKDIEEEVKE